MNGRRFPHLSLCLALSAIPVALAPTCSLDAPETRGKVLASQESGSPAPPKASPPTSHFSPELATPFFSQGLAKAAAKNFALRNWKEAERDFRAYLRAFNDHLNPRDKARIQVLIALSQTKQQQWLPAANTLSASIGQLEHIRDYLHYQSARAYYFAKRPQKALTYAKKVSQRSPQSADAQLLIGDILRLQKRTTKVMKHYQQYLDKHPRGVRHTEARFRLAQAQQALGLPAKALDNYRTITIQAPLSRWAEKAQSSIRKLLPKLSKTQQTKFSRWDANQWMERGMAYYRAMRNPLSAADFRAALGAPGLTPDTACIAAYHLANSWFKQRDRNQSAPLFDTSSQLCAKTNNVDLQVKSAYQAGRSYALLRQHETAALRYAKAEKLGKNHSYADDARLRQAEEHTSLQNDKRTEELLSSIPTLYPQGDMRAEAMWRLAWRAYRNQEYHQARKWLNKQIEIMPIEHNYWAEGQPQYWLGRIAEKLRQKRAAIRHYSDTILTYPLSYYSLLAFSRLAENHPGAYKKLTRQITRAQSDNAPATLRFQPREVYATKQFRRALEFLRLGLGQPAQAELHRLGFKTPQGKQPLHDPDEIDKVWAMAFLHHQAGRYSTSHWVTRWHVNDFKRYWPIATNRRQWRIAYPKPYWQMIKKFATRYHYPTALQTAIMREESAFDPLRESTANAIGLTQLIFPTARRFGKGTGIIISRKNLRDPEKNVHIGGRFLSFLWNKWDQRILLVPPSYNAGEGATARWLRARGTWSADEWVEAIPADQPRRYSKRVLSSYFAYSYLEDGTIPTVSNTIPSKLIKSVRKR